MSKMFSKVKLALFVAICGAVVFCGGGCNDFSAKESVEAGRPILGGVSGEVGALPFTLAAPEYDWKRPSNSWSLGDTLNLEGKKLKVTVTGKHVKAKPDGGIDGLKFVMVDADRKESTEYALGWFGTEGRVLEGIYEPKDGSDTNWETGVTTPHNCDFKKIVALKFINYSYVNIPEGQDHAWDCVEGTGVELTVTDVKFEVID